MYPGDQHLPENDRSGQSNPFAPQTPSITRASAQEIATLQAKLDRKLGPEYISDRPGAGGIKVQYLEAWKCINLANEIFGFNGWSSSIQNITVDYMDENRETGRVSLGLSVVVRVTLKDGVYHEDIGYGSIENARSKAAAFEKCKKEGTSDALKRALRNFGNVLGNCLYDKTYLREVSKIKLPAPQFELNELHRRPEFVTPMAMSDKPLGNNADHLLVDDKLFQDKFDDNYFDDYDFEDRPLLPESPRLNEFEINTLPITSNDISLPIPQKSPITGLNTSFQGDPQLPNAKTLDISGPAEPLVNSSKDTTLINPTMDSSDLANPPPINQAEQLSRTILQRRPLEKSQLQTHPTPNIMTFARVARDGTIISQYDHKSGNFSPSAATKVSGIDYTKSAPILRQRIPKVPLASNTDVYNRMNQTSLGIIQSHRMVGCPPGSHLGTHNRIHPHMRSKPGSPPGGTKRDVQGQVISGGGTIARSIDETCGKTGQGDTRQPDTKRARN